VISIPDDASLIANTDIGTAAKAGQASGAVSKEQADTTAVTFASFSPRPMKQDTEARTDSEGVQLEASENAQSNSVPDLGPPLQKDHVAGSPLPGFVHRETDANPTREMHSGPMLHGLNGIAGPATPRSQGFAGDSENAVASTSSVPATALEGRVSIPDRSQASGTDPFRQLDQAASSSGTILHTATSRVEVGVHDPAMGWLEIKAQSTAGQISAK
jgi:hypothetical protein